jgi:hypothetical protein
MRWRGRWGTFYVVLRMLFPLPGVVMKLQRFVAPVSFLPGALDLMVMADPFLQWFLSRPFHLFPLATDVNRAGKCASAKSIIVFSTGERRTSYGNNPECKNYLPTAVLVVRVRRYGGLIVRRTWQSSVGRCQGRKILRFATNRSIEARIPDKFGLKL